LTADEARLANPDRGVVEQDSAGFDIDPEDVRALSQGLAMLFDLWGGHQQAQPCEAAGFAEAHGSLRQKLFDFLLRGFEVGVGEEL